MILSRWFATIEDLQMDEITGLITFEKEAFVPEAKRRASDERPVRSIPTGSVHSARDWSDELASDDSIPTRRTAVRHLAQREPIDLPRQERSVYRGASLLSPLERAASSE